jgi:type IV pilus assembly protein PilV
MDTLRLKKECVQMPRKYCARTGDGFTLIEVLITIVVIAIGLLGLAGLQVTTLNNQFEAYQRAQALMILEDMSSRIRANAAAAKADEYSEGVLYGLLPEADCSTETTTANRDLCEWNITLAGSGIKLETGNPDTEDVGSVLGARGCIENIVGSTDGETIIRLTIAWQGLTETRAPGLEYDCGENQYGDDGFRRVVSLDTVLANLVLP